MSTTLRQTLRRTTLPLRTSATPHNHQQTRHATLIKRPKRPYTFTQLVTLTDGSTFLHRTTSPLPVYKSTKDARNSALWNPSSQKLLNVEEDEAGKLRSFRQKFGRGWDAEAVEYNEESTSEGGSSVVEQPDTKDDSLFDLIAGFSQKATEQSGSNSGGDAGRSGEKGKGGKDGKK